MDPKLTHYFTNIFQVIKNGQGVGFKFFFCTYLRGSNSGFGCVLCKQYSLHPKKIVLNLSFKWIHLRDNLFQTEGVILYKLEVQLKKHYQEIKKLLHEPGLFF